MAKEPSTPVPSFALGIINCAACLLAQALLNYTASMSSANTSGLMYLRDTFHSGRGCDSAFCLGMGKAGSRTGKTPSLMILIRQICTPPNSLVKVHQGLGSVDEQSCWLRFLLGPHRYSQPAKMCASCYKPVPSSLSQPDSPWSSPANGPEIPMGWDQSRGSHKEIHNVGGGWGPACPHRVIFSHRSNRSFSKDLSVVLRWSWGEAGWSTRRCFPDPLMQSVWVSLLQGGSASASHPHPGILSGVSHSWIVLFALLVRVAESRMTYVAILVRVKVFNDWDKWHLIGRKSHCPHSFSMKLKLEDVQVSLKYVFMSKKWLMWLKVRSLLPLKLPISSFFFRHTNFIHGNWITGILLSLHSKCKKH